MDHIALNCEPNLVACDGWFWEEFHRAKADAEWNNGTYWGHSPLTDWLFCVWVCSEWMAKWRDEELIKMPGLINRLSNWLASHIETKHCLTSCMESWTARWMSCYAVVAISVSFHQSNTLLLNVDRLWKKYGLMRKWRKMATYAVESSAFLR